MRIIDIIRKSVTGHDALSASYADGVGAETQKAI
jgi:hypothetical protein